MIEFQTISWIFLATAIASQSEPTDKNEISDIADFINHLVPTQKQMQISITWLSEKELLIKLGKKYILSPIGKVEYENASKKTGVLFEIWKNLEEKLRNYA